MNRKQLEFLISQFLDDTLSSEDREQLEQALASDPEARKLLEEHQKIDQALKAESDIASVKWDRLAEAIANRLAAENEVAPEIAPAEGEMDPAAEYQITQYLDGELPPEEHAAVEKRLAADPAARRILSEHRALDTVLKHAWPLPDVNWNRLHERISEAVADEMAPASLPITGHMSIMGRVVRYAPRLAIAAALLLAMGLAAFIYFSRPPATTHPPVARTFKVEVEPMVARSNAKPVMEIAFGPATNDAQGFYQSDASGVVAMNEQFDLQMAIAPRGSSETDAFPF